MSKLAPTSIKYLIKAQINAKGVIEKPDVIGAIFGQTEGLLGPDLDLRELQRTGRIGRIEVNIRSDKGNSYGELIIPSSLDSTETALIAATLETIERVGPCTAKIILKSVEDTREMKRKFVVDKAKTILKDLLEKGLPDTSKITEDIKEEIKTHEITAYKGLPCGPNLLDSDEIVIVEGRADVVNLIKYGIKNAIAIEGSSIPQTIAELSKEKITTAFVDGDRGGDLNLKGLIETTDLDYIAVAPPGKEVEELSKKEVFKCLRDKISSSQFKLEKMNEAKKERPKIEQKYKKREISITEDQKKIFKKTLEELIGTRAACIFDSTFNLLGKVPVKELINTLKTVENPYAVIFDGRVDYKLESIAKRKDIKFLVGMEKENIRSSIGILSKEDLK
ncbi:MAG: DNA primase [Candidatus Aenigmarchaeota archaeon]|nr:DNA primase [Candidatus Aenigmarchaeota archaeon]NIP39938.1 DNA primase [Candidatus Aenigmarchaeota archaeon]NIQ17657.1 DNA primase [Candidatus Aenigmarchaeota archaeon]NIS72845.1 DNA primase [Candidatus Aenigmarchaeota archaeon]